MKKPYLKKNNEQGFTLIEFIVVLVIFSIMSGTSLFNYIEYRNNIQTTNVAQDVALTIRQAQVYGISASDGFDSEDVFASNNDNTINIIDDRSIRGFAINTESQEIILFEDINRNFSYDPENDRVIDIRKIISENINISACLFSSEVSPTPGNCSEEVTVNTNGDTIVSIAFERPYPDAFIHFENTQYSHVLIELKDNAGNNLRYIEVNPIGNISVKSYD